MSPEEILYSPINPSILGYKGNTVYCPYVPLFRLPNRTHIGDTRWKITVEEIFAPAKEF